MAKVICKKLKGLKNFERLVGVHGQVKGMRSGFVVLQKNESVGQHNTGEKEEAIIILKGKARLYYRTKSITVGENSFLYIPKNTVHDMKNVSSVPLKYVYVTVSR